LINQERPRRGRGKAPLTSLAGLITEAGRVYRLMRRDKLDAEQCKSLVWVLAQAVRCTGSNKNRQRVWLCRCDCDRQTMVRATNLRSGNTKSCGCCQREAGCRNLLRSARRCPRNDSGRAFCPVGMHWSRESAAGPGAPLPSPSAWRRSAWC
jgi:hypothetical protein